MFTHDNKPEPRFRTKSCMNPFFKKKQKKLNLITAQKCIRFSNPSFIFTLCCFSYIFSVCLRLDALSVRLCYLLQRGSTGSFCVQIRLLWPAAGSGWWWGCGGSGGGFTHRADPRLPRALFGAPLGFPRLLQAPGAASPPHLHAVLFTGDVLGLTLMGRVAQ